jgi:transcription elongation factor Elf1
MKAREIFITMVALVAIGVTSFFAYRYEQKRKTAGMCPFCERMVHPVTAYRMKIGNHVMVACCPRCGMHAQLRETQGSSSAAWATDVNTGESVAAESATYVEGGDAQYCTHGDQPMTREPNGVSMRDYDRCLPTLAAFKTPQEAEAYQQQHGGRVLTFAQALASVNEQ